MVRRTSMIISRDMLRSLVSLRSARRNFRRVLMNQTFSHWIWHRNWQKLLELQVDLISPDRKFDSMARKASNAIKFVYLSLCLHKSLVSRIHFIIKTSFNNIQQQMPTNDVSVHLHGESLCLPKQIVELLLLLPLLFPEFIFKWDFPAEINDY